MKKLLPFILLTSLLFSACSIDLTGEKDKKIAELEKQTQDDVFRKKQECQKYQNEIEKWIEKREKELNDTWDFYDERLEEIFYSYVKKSCIALIYSNWIHQEKKEESEQYEIILDILTNDQTNYNRKDQKMMLLYSNEVASLKWNNISK